MPLYEYQCEACSHRFEIIRKFSDLPVEKCPVCGGAVHKLQSAPAFQFKGSGWYVTDYARKDSAPAGESSGNGAKPDASTSGEKAEKSEKSEKGEKTAKTGESSSSSAGDTSASTPSAASSPTAK